MRAAIEKLDQMWIRRELDAARSERERLRAAITSSLGALLGVANGKYPRTVAVVTESGWRYEATSRRASFEVSSYYPGDFEAGETHTKEGRGSNLAEALTALWAAEDTKR